MANVIAGGGECKGGMAVRNGNNSEDANISLRFDQNLMLERTEP